MLCDFSSVYFSGNLYQRKNSNYEITCTELFIAILFILVEEKNKVKKEFNINLKINGLDIVHQLKSIK
jgi:hypothetical protein